MRAKEQLKSLFDAAVAAASPAHCLPPHLPAPGPGRHFVIAAGKAAVSMAAALVEHYPAPVTGLAVTRDGHGIARAIPGIEVIAAGHPVVDARSIIAGRKALALATSAGRGDRVIVLLSGGASALLECPLPGVQLEDLATVNRELLGAGADIHRINVVRKRLSAIKGGGLAMAVAPAELSVLAISDVPGDRLADIGSGPCSADDSDPAAARRILHECGCAATPAVWAAVAGPPGPGAAAAVFKGLHERIIARPADAVAAAVRAARAAGFEPVDLGADSVGPATELASEHAVMTRALVAGGGRHALISGGETTVRVMNPDGRGGRNTEYALALALDLDGEPDACALAADTDGIDGTGDNAGAFVFPDTLRRAVTERLSARDLLAANRSYDFFAGLDDLFTTGPTLTNVNDLRIVLVGGRNSGE